MKKLFWVAGALILFVIAYVGMSSAQDQTDVGTTQASGSENAPTSSSGEGSDKGWKQELASDKETVKGARDTIKSNFGAARQEEQQLREQIKQARVSGDMETAKSLEAQLKSTHVENMQQKQQDISALREARHEMRQDRREARQDRMERREDRREGDHDRGPVGQVHEKRMERREDRREGGQHMGPRGHGDPDGGPGASPDRGNQGVKDHGRGQGRDGRGQGGGHGGGGRK